jgi:hypothetical protein
MTKENFGDWWKAQPASVRRDCAFRAGTSDDYICKYLIPKHRTPRLPLVKRLFHCLPSGHPFDHQDLVNFFFNKE